MQDRRRIIGIVSSVTLFLLAFPLHLPAQQEPTSTKNLSGPDWVADATKARIPRHGAKGWLLGKEFVVGMTDFGNGRILDSFPRPREDRSTDYEIYRLFFQSGRTVLEGDIFSTLLGTRALSDRIEITLRLQRGKNLAGRTVLVFPSDTKAGSASPGAKQFLYQAAAPISVALVPQGRDMTEATYLEDRGDAFTLRLVFGRQTADTLRGQIYLCINDKKRSFLAGSFFAKEHSEKHLKF